MPQAMPNALSRRFMKIAESRSTVTSHSSSISIDTSAWQVNKHMST
jgi:hypothetical protein